MQNTNVMMTDGPGAGSIKPHSVYINCTTDMISQEDIETIGYEHTTGVIDSYTVTYSGTIYYGPNSFSGILQHLSNITTAGGFVSGLGGAAAGSGFLSYAGFLVMIFSTAYNWCTASNDPLSYGFYDVYTIQYIGSYWDYNTVTGTSTLVHYITTVIVYVSGGNTYYEGSTTEEWYEYVYD